MKIRDTIKFYKMSNDDVNLIRMRFMYKYDATLKFRNGQRSYSLDTLNDLN